MTAHSGSPGGVVLLGAVGGCGTSLVAGALALAWQRSGHATWLVELDGRPGDLGAAWDLPGERSLTDLVAVAAELTPAHLTAAGRIHPSGLTVLGGPATPGDPWTTEGAACLTATVRESGGRCLVDAGAALSAAAAGAARGCGSVLVVCPPRVVAARRAHALIGALTATAAPDRCALVVVAMPGRPEIGAAALGRVVGVPVAGEVPWNAREAGALGAGRWPRARRRGIVAAVTRLAGAIR